MNEGELPLDLINSLLKTEPTTKKRGRSGRRKTGPDTSVRDIAVWMKLNHHMCLSFCEHRSEQDPPTGKACWNPNCIDPRVKADRGTQIVARIDTDSTETGYVYMCRYCFLDGWMK